MRRLLSIPLLLASLAAAGHAAAQSAPPARSGANVALDVTVAQRLLEEGQKLLAAGRAKEAKEKIEASLRKEPTAAAMLALGACHEALGATASAWGEFKRAAREARVAGDKVIEEEAGKRALALAPRLWKVRVVVASPAPGIEVTLDDRQALGEDAWGTPLPLDPGWHKLDAVAPGRKKASTAFQVRAGEALVEVVVPALVVPPPPSPPKPPRAPDLPPSKPQPTSGTSGMDVAAIALMSVGMLGVSAALGIGCIGLGIPSGRPTHLSGGAVAGAVTAGIVGTGMFVLGLRAVIYKTFTSTPTKSVTSIGVYPMAFGSGGGVGLHGTW